MSNSLYAKMRASLRKSLVAGKMPTEWLVGGSAKKMLLRESEATQSVAFLSDGHLTFLGIEIVMDRNLPDNVIVCKSGSDEIDRFQILN